MTVTYIPRLYPEIHRSTSFEGGGTCGVRRRKTFGCHDVETSLFFESRSTRRVFGRLHIMTMALTVFGTQFSHHRKPQSTHNYYRCTSSACVTVTAAAILCYLLSAIHGIVWRCAPRLLSLATVDSLLWALVNVVARTMGLSRVDLLLAILS